MISSINKNTYQQLLLLREQVSLFQTVRCALMHEEVEEILGEVITAETDLEKMRVRRKGFCAMALRKNLLGCAHAPSNHMFTRFADAVHATGILGSQPLPSIKINELLMGIYSLDHEKGRMEKRFALAKQQGEACSIQEVQSLLHDLIAKHEDLLSQLENIRLMVLNRLNEVISEKGEQLFFE